MRAALFVALGIFTVVFCTVWFTSIARNRQKDSAPDVRGTFVGFVTNFFDTLGIGSFAPTTSLFKLLRFVPDERIPGTLNVGHTLPTIVEAFIYIGIIAVEPPTLVLLIARGGRRGVARRRRRRAWPRRNVQIGMGVALLGGGRAFRDEQPQGKPVGLSGTALGLSGTRLVIGVVASSVLGRADDARNRNVRPVHDSREPARHEPRRRVPDHDGIVRVPDAGREPALHSLKCVLDARRARPDARRNSGRPHRRVHRP